MHNCCFKSSTGAVALKLAQDGHRSDEQDLRKDKRNLKIELKEQELANEDVAKALIRVGVFLSLFYLLKSYFIKRIHIDIIERGLQIARFWNCLKPIFKSKIIRKVTIY